MSMPIIYCCLIAKTEKVLLAESTLTESYYKRIKGLLNNILKKVKYDTIEIENEQIVTFLKTKKLIFICVSLLNLGKERPKRCIEQFTSLVVNAFNGIENVIPSTETNSNIITKLCYQDKLDLNKLLKNFDTGIQTASIKNLINEMNMDLSELKRDMSKSIKKIVGNITDLDELLLVSKKINEDAVEYKDNAKELEHETRCCKPWIIILSLVIIITFIVYSIFALYLCGNLTVTCERKKFY